jgi:hypothetical protein
MVFKHEQCHKSNISNPTPQFYKKCGENVSHLFHLDSSRLVSKNVCSTGAQIFQKSGSYLKIVGAGWVIICKFHIEDPQILGTTAQNLVT